MKIITTQDALDWLALNIQGSKEDCIAVIKLQVLISQVSEPKNMEKMDWNIPELNKMLNQIKEQEDDNMENQNTLEQTTQEQRTIMIQSGVFNDFIETYIKVVCKNLGYDEDKAVAELSYLFDTCTYDELKGKLL